MNQQAQDRLVAATRGTQLGAIICCALDIERDATPRFMGKGMMTSDGFIMCNFIDRDGFGHLGAFVGRHDDYVRNVIGVTRHCKLAPEDMDAFYVVMNKWCPLNIERKVS